MSSETIIVVDDDADTLEFMELCLTMAGYLVIPWPSGDGAYELIRREQPCMVIMDVQLGGQISGWTLLADLRRDPLTAATPAIMYSGGSRELEANHVALQSLRCEILMKPFHADDLLALVARVCLP